MTYAAGSAVPIGIIGGSGLYRFFETAGSSAASTDREMRTPYGPAAVSIGEVGGRRVAFLTRHGGGHALAPHQIGYRANIWALASLGVRAIVSSSAVGGLTPDYPPGTLVLTDQFIDRTSVRADTFYDQGSVQHLAAADPFCRRLRAVSSRALTQAGETFAASGTVVVIQGPRFSTRAESIWFRAAGAHTINMTMCPEVPLASELNIGTVNLSIVTDTDSGVAATDGGRDEDAANGALVLERLAAAQPRIIAALTAIVGAIPDDYQADELIPPAEVAAVLARPTA